MRTLLLLLCCVSAHASAPPYYGTLISTATGKATQYVSGSIRVAASAASADTATIVLDGSTGKIYADGSSLTNIASSSFTGVLSVAQGGTGSTTTAGAAAALGLSVGSIASTATLNGFSSTLGVGTTFFSYQTDTDITLTRISVTIVSAGSGGTGDTYACQDGAGHSISVTATANAPRGSIFTASGSAAVSQGDTVNGLLLISASTSTPVVNATCSYAKSQTANSLAATANFPANSTGAVTTAIFGTSSTKWITEVSLSTLTLVMSGGRASLDFACESKANSSDGIVFAGALIDGAFFNRESTTAGFISCFGTGVAGFDTTCPMTFSVKTLNPLSAGTHKFAFVYRVSGGGLTNFFNNNSQACQFSVTEL